MEEQLHRHTSGTDVHEERETKSMLKKVKEKMKDTIKHGHEEDEAHTFNNSAVVRSGLAQPTVMGTPVLAEDLYATHSDIVDPPMRSFSQWEEEETHGDPPPFSTGAFGTHPEDLSQFGHHAYHRDVTRQQSKDSSLEQQATSIDKDPYYPTAMAPTGYATHFKATGTDPYNPTGNYATCEFDAPKPQPQPIDVYMTHPAGDHAYDDQEDNTNRSRMVLEEDPSAPANRTMRVSPGNYQTKVTDPTNTGGKEATGITDVLHSFNKMKVFQEPGSKSTKPNQGKTEVFTGSHDQFAPEPVIENQPQDTIASSDPSNLNSSYTRKITSATSAIAAAVKDSIISKLISSSDENKSTEMNSEPHKTKTKPSSATDYAHVVADALSGTLGPVYERVADTGSSMMSKMQGSGHDESFTSPSRTNKGTTVKEYLVDAFKPGDDDKLLSEKITNVFNPGKGNAPQETTTTKTTTYVIGDEGERRLQDSGN